MVLKSLSVDSYEVCDTLSSEKNITCEEYR